MDQGIIKTVKCVIVPIGVDYSPEHDILYYGSMYYRNRIYQVYTTREAFYESFGRWVSNFPYNGDILIGKKETPRIEDFSPCFGVVKFRDGIYYPSHTDHPTPDNKQEPAEYATDSVGSDLDEEALLRLKSKFTMDEIKENFKLLGPTTTYCMTKEEMREAIQSLLDKAKKGEFDKPSYVTEYEVWRRFRELQEALISAEARERVDDNLKSIDNNS